MPSSEEPRGKRGTTAHVARNSHARGGGHAAPGMGRNAVRAANVARGAPKRPSGFIARQAAMAAAWTDPLALLEEDDDTPMAQHPLYQGMKFADYEYREYPKFVGDKIANNEEEEKVLLAGEPLLREPEERARMQLICDVKNIVYDKRWGVEKLRRIIIDAGYDPKFDPTK